MVLCDSIFNIKPSDHLIEKSKEDYEFPINSVIHSDHFKILKEKDNRCLKSTEYFILIDNQLYIVAEEPQIEYNIIRFTTKAIMDLDSVMCSFKVKEYPKNNKYYIEFSKNNKRAICDALNEYSYFKWKEVLRPRVIQYNFQSFYNRETLLSMKKDCKMYKITDNKNNDIYFADKIDKERLSDNSRIYDLKEQIKILQTLSGQEGVLQLYEIYETRNSVYLIYKPYLGGPVFNHNLKYSFKCFIKILRSILSILRLLEIKGISHGYLRPKNIYFKHSNIPVEENEIIITDFSYSKVIPNNSRKSLDIERRKSRIIGEHMEESPINTDIIDLGLMALNYLHYAHFNIVLDHTISYETTILNPSFAIPHECKLISKRPFVTYDKQGLSYPYFNF